MSGDRLAADLRAQEEWGKWNTAPAANRLYAARMAALPPWRQALHRAAGRAFEGAALVAGYGLAGLFVYNLLRMAGAL